MNTRRYVKDPRWAKLKQEIEKAIDQAERAWKKLQRQFRACERLDRRIKNLSRRLAKREGELDIAAFSRKEEAS